ncbi:DUF2239 family protein [Lysobacter capsici]|uniref:DUF2239 family protein n=1 Tax=Lysobacter capsici TaxID=435897 RepID=UPI001BFFE7E2|nr:DUF2239 family protein [Lysobacter capsici]QWF19599.1 DUF2239 family protein [Lysobacter capsici]
MPRSLTYTGFDGHRRVTTGALSDVAIAIKHASEAGQPGPLLIFDDATGRSIDVNLQGSDAAVRARLAKLDAAANCANDADPASETPSEPEPARGRGRPRLGVVAREVTLLPRHWDWLATQPGGASVALRKLVEQARRSHDADDRRRRAHERAYHFMSALAGDLPGYEEATRAVFADDRARLRVLIAYWPEDVREHALMLAAHEEA